jgi:hypothetical protein
VAVDTPLRRASSRMFTADPFCANGQGTVDKGGNMRTT